MDLTSLLPTLTAVAVLGLAGIVLVTQEGAGGVNRKHVYPSLVVYGAVAVSIVMSLLSPRLTSTSVATVAGGALTGTVAQAAAGAALLALAVALFVALKKRARMPALTAVLLMYGGVGFVSAIINDQPLELGLAYMYCLVAGLGLVAAWTITEAWIVVRRCLRAYIWLSLALIVVAPAIAFWDVQGRVLFGFKQLAGVTTHPNGLGTIAALAVFVELARPGQSKMQRVHLVAAISTLVLTQSRGAWLAAIIGLVFWQIGRSKGASLAVMVSSVGVSIAGSLLLQERLMGLLETDSDARDLATLNGRTLIWERALEPVANSPWIGHGPLVFDTRFRWQALGLADDAGSSNSHNQVIQTLVERGGVGLILLVLFSALLVRAAWKQPIRYRGATLAMTMVFVSRFAVETTLYVSVGSLNGAVVVMLVALMTASGLSERQVVSPKTISLDRGR